jgi:hypothetical protein
MSTLKKESKIFQQLNTDNNYDNILKWNEENDPFHEGDDVYNGVTSCFNVANYIASLWGIKLSEQPELQQIELAKFRRATGVYYCEITNTQETHAFVLVLTKTNVILTSGYGGYNGVIHHEFDKEEWFDQLISLSEITNNNQRLYIFQGLFKLPETIFWPLYGYTNDVQFQDFLMGYKIESFKTGIKKNSKSKASGKGFSNSTIMKSLRYGNYVGPGWTNGKEIDAVEGEFDDVPEDQLPIDELDHSAFIHDRTYKEGNYQKADVDFYNNTVGLNKGIRSNLYGLAVGAQGLLRKFNIMEDSRKDMATTEESNLDEATLDPAHDNIEHIPKYKEMSDKRPALLREKKAPGKGYREMLAAKRNAREEMKKAMTDSSLAPPSEWLKKTNKLIEEKRKLQKEMTKPYVKRAPGHGYSDKVIAQYESPSDWVENTNKQLENGIKLKEEEERYIAEVAASNNKYEEEQKYIHEQASSFMLSPQPYISSGEAGYAQQQEYLNEQAAFFAIDSEKLMENQKQYDEHKEREDAIKLDMEVESIERQAEYFKQFGQSGDDIDNEIIARASDGRHIITKKTEVWMGFHKEFERETDHLFGLCLNSEISDRERLLNVWKKYADTEETVWNEYLSKLAASGNAEVDDASNTIIHEGYAIIKDQVEEQYQTILGNIQAGKEFDKKYQELKEIIPEQINSNENPTIAIEKKVEADIETKKKEERLNADVILMIKNSEQTMTARQADYVKLVDQQILAKKLLAEQHERENAVPTNPVQNKQIIIEEYLIMLEKTIFDQTQVNAKRRIEQHTMDQIARQEKRKGDLALYRYRQMQLRNLSPIEAKMYNQIKKELFPKVGNISVPFTPIPLEDYNPMVELDEMEDTNFTHSTLKNYTMDLDHFNTTPKAKRRRGNPLELTPISEIAKQFKGTDKRRLPKNKKPLRSMSDIANQLQPTFKFGKSKSNKKVRFSDQPPPYPFNEFPNPIGSPPPYSESKHITFSTIGSLFGPTTFIGSQMIGQPAEVVQDQISHMEDSRQQLQQQLDADKARLAALQEENRVMVAEHNAVIADRISSGDPIQIAQGVQNLNYASGLALQDLVNVEEAGYLDADVLNLNAALNMRDNVITDLQNILVHNDVIQAKDQMIQTLAEQPPETKSAAVQILDASGNPTEADWLAAQNARLQGLGGIPRVRFVDGTNDPTKVNNFRDWLDIKQQQQQLKENLIKTGQFNALHKLFPEEPRVFHPNRSDMPPGSNMKLRKRKSTSSSTRTPKRYSSTRTPKRYFSKAEDTRLLNDEKKLFMALQHTHNIKQSGNADRKLLLQEKKLLNILMSRRMTTSKGYTQAMLTREQKLIQHLIKRNKDKLDGVIYSGADDRRILTEEKKIFAELFN